MSDPRAPDVGKGSPPDAVWESLAHGRLSDEQAGLLRALGEADPAVQCHVAAYQPLAATAVESIACAAEQSLARHRQKRRRALVGVAAGALAVAAAAMLMVRPAGVEPTLPAYQLRVSQGVTSDRGAAAPRDVPRFEPESQLDLVARPLTHVRERVEARGYLVRGQELVLLPISFRTEAGGAAHWRGPARELLRRGPGRFQIAVVVGAPLPGEAETRRWVARGDPRVLRQDVDYAGPEASLDRASEAAFAAVDAARESGHLDEAEARLATLVRSADDAVRVRALGVLPRISAARGDVARAVDQLEMAARAARGAGFERRALDARLVRADWLRRKLFRVADAERALDEVARDFAGLPGVSALVAYQRALCAIDRGDVRRALAEFDLAIAQDVPESGRASLRLAALEMKAPLLSAIGRSREAEALLHEAEALVPDDACEQSAYFTNRGWLSLLAAERYEGQVDRAALERAFSVAKDGCADTSFAQNAAVNLALAAAIAEDTQGAQRWLNVAQAQGASVEPVVASWTIDIRGRVALAQGEAHKALALFEELEARTGVAAEAADRWRASLGVARAQRALGAREEALSAYRRAERALDEETVVIPFHGGRETFAGARDVSARELASLELSGGDAAAAYRALRRARSRALRSMSLHDGLTRLDGAKRQRLSAALEEHWRALHMLEASQASAYTAPLDEVPALERAADEARLTARAALDRALDAVGADLAAPDPAPAAPGELVLAYFPLERGWVGFAETSAGLRSAKVPVPDRVAPEALLDTLLAPFDRELGRAERVRLLTYGALRALDLHALPYRGVPLIERLPVVYGADLGPRPHAATGRAVVVSDPRGNLGKARDEGRVLTERLRAAGVEVTLLEGALATRGAVEAALASADLLHVAAHAEGPGEHNPLGAILLAGEERLEVGDVLALHAVPREVVLSTCEGALEPDAKVPGLGLAQAFLVRGAEQVVASMQRVPDALAEEFARSLYEAPGEDLGTRFQKAVRSIRARHPDDDHWKSYRAWVR